MFKSFVKITDKTLSLPNAAGLDEELHLCERMRRDQQARQADIPERISDTLKLVDKQAFVDIFTILQILATVPISSSSCERSISTLRNLKNYLRNTMGQERLNGLALRQSHVNFDMNSIVDLFANLHPRRMRVANILQVDENNG
ncbi:52 kDa repressor of the inhibitor of the protein kinase-like [Montipora foliosa]|uniref:52 kDa repressor of the inhibitor of the protein kinase-like n=1 Tax=Montipora foliosa TaxID=591990 RepID=UPI0035F1E62E